MDITGLMSRITEGLNIYYRGAMHDIERDILLADIRKLYDMVKYQEVKDIEQTATEGKNLNSIHASVIDSDNHETNSRIVSNNIETNNDNSKGNIMVENTVKEESANESTLTEQFAVKGNSINDLLDKRKPTLNEQLAVSTRSKLALNDKVVKRDFAGLIDFNKKHIFLQELFQADIVALDEAIEHINGAATVQEAFDYIRTELLPVYKWDPKAHSTRLFDKLVRQQFS